MQGRRQATVVNRTTTNRCRRFVSMQAHFVIQSTTFAQIRRLRTRRSVIQSTEPGAARPSAGLVEDGLNPRRVAGSAEIDHGDK